MLRYLSRGTTRVLSYAEAVTHGNGGPVCDDKGRERFDPYLLMPW